LTRQVLGGGAVEVQHNRASERNTLVGKTTAGKRPRAALVDTARSAVAATARKPAGGEAHQWRGRGRRPGVAEPAADHDVSTGASLEKVASPLITSSG